VVLENYENFFILFGLIKKGRNIWNKVLFFMLKCGGHFYLVGIERDKPVNEGLLLENPVTINGAGNGEMQYYSLSDYKNRFEGKIFYLFIFDTCEDIYDASFSVFKDLFNNQIIIE
jgi:hypothetical protein